MVFLLPSWLDVETTGYLLIWFAYSAPMSRVVGIDLSATNLQFGVVDTDNAIVGRARAKTQAAQGRDQVRGMYEAATRLYDNGTPLTRHVTTNSIIQVDEEAGTASARSSYTVFQRTESLPLQPIIIGRYHDTFKRMDERWWFDKRVMLVDLVGDLSHHLLYTLP